MHEETARVDQNPEASDRASGCRDGRAGTGAPSGAEQEGELLALRVQLVLSQLEHPSRWGKPNR